MKLLPLAILSLSLHILSPVASAQFGGKAGFSEAFKPDLLPRDMTMIVETLILEDWQRPIVQSLLEDYKDSFKTGTDAIREKMVNSAKLQKNGAPKDMRSLLSPIESWMPEKERLFQDLMGSIKTQLSDTQLERWPKFERAVRRTRSLDDSDLSGEGVDLISILNQMQLTQDVLDPALPAMEQYEIALDAALKTRDARITALLPKFTAAMETMDMQTGGDLQGQIMSERVLVRNIQDESIEKIALLLSAPFAQDFRTRALSQGYREVFQPDALSNFFAAVLNLNDLTAEQKTAIQSAQTAWETNFYALQTRMLDMTRADEPTKAKRKMLANAAKKAAKEGTKSPEVPPDLMIPLRNEKNKLIQDTRQAVLALLNQDQVERLSVDNPGMRQSAPSTNPSMHESVSKPKQTDGNKKSPAGAATGADAPPTNPGGVE